MTTEENGITFAGFRSIYVDESKNESQSWKAEGNKQTADAASAFSFIEDLGFEWNPTTVCNINFFESSGSSDKLVLSDKIKLEFQTAQKGAIKYQSQGLIMIKSLQKISHDGTMELKKKLGDLMTKKNEIDYILSFEEFPDGKKLSVEGIQTVIKAPFP